MDNRNQTSTSGGEVPSKHFLMLLLMVFFFGLGVFHPISTRYQAVQCVVQWSAPSTKRDGERETFAFSPITRQICYLLCEK